MATSTEPGRERPVGAPPADLLHPTHQSGPSGDPPPLGRLYRSQHDRTVGGVCGGLGEYFVIDPVWFRIGFILLAFGGGSSLLLYLLLWVVVPERPAGTEPAPRPPRSTPPGGVVVGLVLVAVGFAILAGSVLPAIGRFFWPLLFLGAGAVLIAGGRRRDR